MTINTEPIVTNKKKQMDLKTIDEKKSDTTNVGGIRVSEARFMRIESH